MYVGVSTSKQAQEPLPDITQMGSNSVLSQRKTMRVERVASKRQCCNVDGEIVDVDCVFSSLCFIPQLGHIRLLKEHVCHSLESLCVS